MLGDFLSDLVDVGVGTFKGLVQIHLLLFPIDLCFHVLLLPELLLHERLVMLI